MLPLPSEYAIHLVHACVKDADEKMLAVVHMFCYM